MIRGYHILVLSMFVIFKAKICWIKILLLNISMPNILYTCVSLCVCGCVTRGFQANKDFTVGIDALISLENFHILLLTQAWPYQSPGHETLSKNG